MSSMKDERFIFSFGLVVITIVSMAIDMKEVALICVGAIAGVFAPRPQDK